MDKFDNDHQNPETAQESQTNQNDIYRQVNSTDSSGGQYQPAITDIPVNHASVTAEIKEVSENTIAGTVGAFIFSLAGGIVWFLLYQIGFVAAISGIVGVICAIKGYEIFAKKLSIHGVVISSLMAFLVIIAAWYMCLSQDVYEAYQIMYTEKTIYTPVSFSDSVRTAYLFLQEPEIAVGYIRDLLFGLIFCIVGAFSYIKTAIRNAKAGS